MEQIYKPFFIACYRRLIFSLLSLLFLPIYAQQTVKVAVRAHSGVEVAKDKWTATIEYLSNSIDGYTFQLVPIVTFDKMRNAVGNNKVDFVLTNPSAYIDLLIKFDIDRIATLINGREKSGNEEFGSVVFVRADRKDINTLEDVRGKSIMGADKEAFGGWLMIYRELLEIDIDPFNDCSEVLFSSTSTNEDIVFEVLLGNVDIGIIRTGVLENLERREEIDLINLKIIDPVNDDFSLVHTSRLYPEWPFATLKSTDQDLSKKVAIALLQMDKKNPAAVLGNYTGWQIPLIYDKVLEILKIVKAPPFNDIVEISKLEFFKLYWHWFLSSLFIVIGLIFLVIYISGLNKKLRETKIFMEEKVDKRTSELKQAYIKLQLENKQRKLSDEKLRKVEERWQFALESSGDGIWDWNVLNNKVFFSKHWKEMIGYEDHEISNNFNEWKKRLHPLDKEKSISDVDKLLSGESDLLNIEHRLLCKDNTYKWILSRGKIVKRTEDNKPLRIIGTHVDLASQKQAEEELIIEKEFSEKIIDTSNAIIVGLDKHHIIKIFNKGAEIITGYAKTEVIGKDWFEIFFPDEIMEVMNKVWKEAWANESHYNENIILSKSGEERMISWQATGIYEGEDTNKHLMISIGEDITERKKSDEKLARFGRIFENSLNELYLFDADTLIFTQVNKAAVQNLGYTIDELLKLTPVDIKPEINKESFEKLITPLRKGKKTKVVFETVHQRKDKSLYEVEVHLQLFRYESGTLFVAIVMDISERKLNERYLLESETRFRSIFENNNTIMVLINPEDGKFIDVNPAAINYYGYSYNHFINKMSIYDINTLNKEEVLLKMKSAKSKKQVFFNFKHKLSNGDIRDVEVYSGPLNFDNKQVLFSIIHDVTEKQEAELNLKFSKDKLESIFRAAPTGIGVVSKRILTEVNQKFCEMMGYKEKELLGKESKMLYPNKEEFEWVGKVKYDQIKEKGTGTVETKMKRKDGKIIDILLSSTPMDMNNLDIGVSFTALDITQQKINVNELEKHRNHLEEIVKKRTDELENSQGALLNLVDDLNSESIKLENANKQLAEINRELETFTYSVSHDLKAPLRGIDGYSQLLLNSFNKDLDPDAKEFLANIRNSTMQMNILIEDLLAYSRMERKDFQMEKVLFKPLINNLLLQYSEIIKSNKVEIKLSFHDEIVLFTNKNGLNLVLRNLLDNAIKFTSHRDNTKIEIACSENTDKWDIFVKDNGIGFDMKYHNRIYKIFQRLHLAEEYEGTGIGLAMVSKAVQRMNGKIWAESKLNKGACFYLEINKPN